MASATPNQSAKVAATPPSAAQFNALRQLKTEMGADGDLLDVLPFSQVVICKHQDQKLLTGKKTALAGKIRMGNIEDESGPVSPLWAYLLDNSMTNGTTDLTYYSFGKRCRQGTRHNATDVHSARLREEFRHCETPSVLTATAKYYLYKKGVTASFPIQVSKTLANLVIRSCKDYRDADHEGNLGKPMEDAAQDNKDMEIIDTVAVGDPMSAFVPPTIGMTPLHAPNHLRETVSSSQHPVPSAYNYLLVSTDSVLMLQAAQARERQIVTAGQSTQQRFDAAKQHVDQLRTKRDVLQVELIQLETAIDAGDAEVVAAEQEKGRYGEAIRICRVEQEEVMNGMDPGVRAMIELGRQMERGSQRRE
ncbi:uncharacterized protein N0V89_005744 [Didymosphaeria variabile]|uniref:Uncharacterized protein n=1 Tax=Didymosphaeria variabile TaxID=1932322 RepID=A0A9W8XLB0_9PLEO|nr:uncharacterized protein N0V89_005744 [Didymosphaeria variabile]KAJ4354012.1 hypothetical protein N0V89_005744 [Didymosphaeria variabile]